LATKTSRKRRWIYWGAGILAFAVLGPLALCSGCFSTAEPTVRLTPEQVRATREFPFGMFDQILRAHVDDQGRVNYTALRRDPSRLDLYLAHVGQVGPTTRPDLFPTDAHKLAFAINAYNATVMRNVINRPPTLQRVDESLADFFYFTEFVIDGEEINLKNYEDDRVRAVFHDPRAHFALNCASGGCPHLPAEAFMPATLNDQLDRETREFVTQTRNVEVLADQRKVRLSQIFEWYADDFLEYERAHEAPNGNQITYINRYRPADQQIPPEYTIEFIPYDWTLNRQPGT
jgi:hypothetical protein